MPAHPLEKELLARLDKQLDAAMKKNLMLLTSGGPPAPGIAGIRAATAKARVYWNQGGPEMNAVRELTVPGPAREVPVVVYYPSAARGLPAFVFLHSGGYRHGDQHANDRQMREIANAWGGIVISADYLHIPEHVFPAAVEETAAVYDWLARSGAEWGIDGGRIAIGGASSGASVALGAAVHLGEPGRFKAAAMIYPIIDDDLETESMHLFDGGHFYPSPKVLGETVAAYVVEPEKRADPRFNLMRADPALFPPTFIASAELDTLRSSAAKLARRLEAADRPTRMKAYEGMMHLFLGYSRSVDKARQCVEDVAQFLREQLPATSA